MEMKQFLSAIAQISEEKGIPEEKVLETIESAIAAAYKKDYGKHGQVIKVKLDKKTGQTEIFQVREVIDQESLKTEEGEERPINEEKEILIDEAKKIKKKVKVGDLLEFKLEAHQDYGRIAAQTAKQVIIQRIREAEQESIHDEFKVRQGEIISGVVQRIEDGNVFFDIGRTSGVLFPSEQIPDEEYHPGQRLKLYLVQVEESMKGLGIILSRSHPDMVKELFKIEVPEIAAGTVVIKSVAREPGSRSKIAVLSREEEIDPIGSLVGQRGTRVQTVINELNGEKIDIIAWDKDKAKFITQALAPAKITEVKIDKKKKEAEVIVPEDQFSLAIGKKGQNVRLAAKLTGWKIDIVSEEGKKASEKKEKPKEEKKIKKKKK